MDTEIRTWYSIDGTFYQAMWTTRDVFGRSLVHEGPMRCTPELAQRDLPEASFGNQICAGRTTTTEIVPLFVKAQHPGYEP